MSNLAYPSIRGLGFTVIRTPEFPVIVQTAPSFSETRIQQAQNPIWHWELLYDFLIDNPLKPTAGNPYTDFRGLLGFFMARGGSFDSFLFPDPDDNFVGPAMLTNPWLPGFPYALGAIVIDPAGHAQQAISVPQGAFSGTSITFNDTGGTTSDGLGPITWQDLGAVGGAYPNPNATLQVVNDGAGNYYSPIQRNMGGFLEDVTDLNPQWLGTYPLNPIAVYNNGALQVGPATGACGGGVDYQLFSPNNGDPPLAVPGASYAGVYLKWCAGNPGAGPITAQFNFYFRVRFEMSKIAFEKWANQWWEAGGENQNKSDTIKLCTSRLRGV